MFISSSSLFLDTPTLSSPPPLREFIQNPVEIINEIAQSLKNGHISPELRNKVPFPEDRMLTHIIHQERVLEKIFKELSEEGKSSSLSFAITFPSDLNKKEVSLSPLHIKIADQVFIIYEAGENKDSWHRIAMDHSNRAIKEVILSALKTESEKEAKKWSNWTVKLKTCASVLTPIDVSFCEDEGMLVYLKPLTPQALISASAHDILSPSENAFLISKAAYALLHSGKRDEENLKNNKTNTLPHLSISEQSARISDFVQSVSPMSQLSSPSIHELPPERTLLEKTIEMRRVMLGYLKDQEKFKLVADFVQHLVNKVLDITKDSSSPLNSHKLIENLRFQESTFEKQYYLLEENDTPLVKALQQLKILIELIDEELSLEESLKLETSDLRNLAQQLENLFDEDFFHRGIQRFITMGWELSLENKEHLLHPLPRSRFKELCSYYTTRSLVGEKQVIEGKGENLDFSVMKTFFQKEKLEILNKTIIRNILHNYTLSQALEVYKSHLAKWEKEKISLTEAIKKISEDFPLLSEEIPQTFSFSKEDFSEVLPKLSLSSPINRGRQIQDLSSDALNFDALIEEINKLSLDLKRPLKDLPSTSEDLKSGITTYHFSDTTPLSQVVTTFSSFVSTYKLLIEKFQPLEKLIEKIEDQKKIEELEKFFLFQKFLEAEANFSKSVYTELQFLSDQLAVSGLGIKKKMIDRLRSKDFLQGESKENDETLYSLLKAAHEKNIPLFLHEGPSQETL